MKKTGVVKVQKSTGLDAIHPQVLTELEEEVAKSLSIIFRWFWQSSEIVTYGKRGSISPIFKKVNKKDLRNYRSVSLTSVPSKTWTRYSWKL